MAGGVPDKTTRVVLLVAGIVTILLVGILTLISITSNQPQSNAITLDKDHAATLDASKVRPTTEPISRVPPSVVVASPLLPTATHDTTNGTSSSSGSTPTSAVTRLRKAPLTHVVSTPAPEDATSAASTTLHGRTLEKGTGLPVSGVVILVKGSGLPRDGISTISEEDGNFSLTFVAEQYSPYTVDATAHPPHVLSNPDQRSAATVVSGEEIADTPIDFYFEKGTSVHGIVKWADGDPIASAAVNARLEDKNGEFNKTVLTGKDGRYELPIPSGSAGVLVCTHENSSLFKSLTTSADGTPSEIDFAFPQRSTLAGRIVQDNGNSFGNIPVQAVLNNQVFSTMADDAGNFEFKSLIPGLYSVRAIPGQDSDLFPDDPISVEVRENQQNADIILKVVIGDRIDVTVVDEGGQPLANAIGVWNASLSGKMSGTAKSDSNGTFIINRIPPNSMVANLVVTLEGYQTEIRRDLHALNGPQRIVLQKSSDVTLLVQWKADQSPVTAYAYRLLKSGWNNFEINAGLQQNRVTDPEGRTVLKEIASGTWRIEITVLSESGEPTPLRESTDFTLDAGSNRDVVVELNGGRTVNGYVTLGSDGPPVSGATVRFEPSSEMGPGQAAVPLSIDPEMTGSDGRFRFDGIPFGRHVLAAEKENLRLAKPYDLLLSSDTPDEDIHLVMETGAEIFGYVRDMDGKAVPKASIFTGWRNPNGGDWQSKWLNADENGYYIMSGLTPGLHQINAYVGNRSMQKDVDVAMGESKQVDFGADGVTISGTVYKNGTPAQTTVELFGENTNWVYVSSDGSGQYSEKVIPGDYLVTIPEVSGCGQGERITIAETPSEQTIDLRVTLAEADIVLVFPDEETFVPGQLVINPRQRISRYQFTRVSMDQPSQHLPILLAGEYQATFASKDGQWQGDSGWINIQPTDDNTITIDVMKIARGVRVGGWALNQLSMDYQVLTFDATGVIESSGTASALVRYEKGRHAVAIQSARLLRDGAIIDQDIHDGWSGTDQSNNNFRMQVGEFESGHGYSLQITIRGDGGGDTQGSVYLSLNQ
ncbi:hypothetical protein IT570_00390 [Candidatus Sumerlaeota bacterium]|nr:hypothetical protein [Candidatus Sumerlaeota bacterium]